jgi:hypothetical protein
MAALGLKSILAPPCGSDLAYIIIRVLVELESHIQSAYTCLHGLLIDKGVDEVISLDERNDSEDDFLELKRFVRLVFAAAEEANYIPDVIFH